VTPTVPRAVQYGGVFGAHLGRAAPGIRTRVPDACKEIAEGPGCFAWLPRQIPHTYANVSASPVHMVGGAVPGGIEEFFAAQAAYFARQQGPPDPERIAAIWAGHGLIVGPPIEVAAARAASRA